MSIMVATGRGATQGVLFKDAEAIERFRQIDTLIVDKTGTLTEGQPAFAMPWAPTALRPPRCCASRQAWTKAVSIRWPRRSWRRRDAAK